MTTSKVAIRLFQTILIFMLFGWISQTYAETPVVNKADVVLDSSLQDYRLPLKSLIVQDDEDNSLSQFFPDTRKQAASSACPFSPNGFPPGQCTWLSDGLVNQNGWLLKFSQSSYRDAWKWWDIVTNANHGQLGYEGDILVLNKNSSLPYGHLFYIEKTLEAGKRWVALHANWNTGSFVKTICGYTIRRVTLEKMSNGQIKVGTGSKTYPMRGFLYKK